MSLMTKLSKQQAQDHLLQYLSKKYEWSCHVSLSLDLPATVTRRGRGHKSSKKDKKALTNRSSSPSSKMSDKKEGIPDRIDTHPAVDPNGKTPRHTATIPKKTPQKSVTVTTHTPATEKRQANTTNATPVVPKSGISFARCRSSLSQSLFSKYNKEIFQNKFPEDLPVTWSKKLKTTAGITHMNTGAVELSIKVVDDETRLADTLLHELCHAAVCLLGDGKKHPAHGKHFWHWASVVNKVYPGSVVSACHSYVIYKPHQWKCTNTSCTQTYSRHTKQGINLETSRCGVCRSTLMYTGIVDRNGQMKKAREPSAFSLYVKENYSRIAKEEAIAMGVTGGKLSKGVIMKKLAEGYRLDQAQLTSENNANSIVKGSGSYEHKGNDEQCGEPLAELLNGMSLCESKNVNDEATAAVNVGVNDVMCIVCEDHPPLVT